MSNVFTSSEYNVALTDELDKAVVQRAQTGFFADHKLRAKFIGKKTVAIPEMGLQGLADYNRVDGFISGVVNVDATPFTLQMDRGRSFQIDREDADESGIADLAGQVAAEFVRTQVIPEVDAYVLSKLAGVSLLAGAGQAVTGNPASDAYKMLKEAQQKAQDAVGYDEELVAFVNGTFMAALQATPEISRHLVINDFKRGELHSKVTSLDGMSILPVQSNRMKTAYTFNDGETGGQEAGGFTPTEAAKSIGLLVVPKRAAALIKKTVETRTYTPKQNLNADAWKVDYRIYYDLVVRESLKQGIVSYTY